MDLYFLSLSSAAGVGIGLGYLFYVKDPRLPDQMGDAPRSVVPGQLLTSTG